MNDRCGVCKNCKALKKIQERVLACVNPPFSSATSKDGGIDYGVTELWNRELKRLPCTADKNNEDDDAWLDQPNDYTTDEDGALIDERSDAK